MRQEKSRKKVVVCTSEYCIETIMKSGIVAFLACFLPVLGLGWSELELGLGLGLWLRLGYGVDLGLLPYLDPTRKCFLAHNSEQLDP